MQMIGGLPALFGVQEGVITDSLGLCYEQAAQRLLQMMTCPVPASAPGSHAVAAKLSRGNPRALPCTLGKRRRCTPAGGRLRGEGFSYIPLLRDREEYPCAPGPNSIPGCGCWHGGSLLIPGCRYLVFPLIPMCRYPHPCSPPHAAAPADLSPGDAGAPVPAAPQGADPCNARGCRYPGFPGCRRPVPCCSLLCRSHGPRRAP